MTAPSLAWLRHNRAFKVWLLSTAQSQLGTALSSVALGFLVLEQTGSAGSLTLTLALSLLPNLLLPLAGVWTDRLGPKGLLVAADALRGGVQLALATAALLGLLTPEVIYAAALLNGLLGAMSGPAASSAVPLLVEADDLPRANGLLASFGQGAWLAGYAAGGVLVTLLGPAWALGLDGLTYLVAALAVGGLVQFRHAAQAQGSETALGFWAELRGGIAALRKSRTLTLIPGLALVANAALGPVLALTPAVMDNLGRGAAGYSLFLMLETGGALLAGTIFARWGGALLPHATVTAGLLLGGLSLAMMAGLGTFPALLAGSALFGLSVGLVNTPLVTLIGSQVAASHLGRAFALLSMTGSLGMPLVLLAITPQADQVPASTFYGLAGGGLALAAAGWWAATRTEAAAYPRRTSV